VDLYNGQPFWDLKSVFEPEERILNEHYDAVIVGGGIAGSLCAYALSIENLRIAVIDKDKMGAGSTLANTGLLHYTNDIMLQDLLMQIGTSKAVRFYQMCQEAILHLGDIANKLPFSSEFAKRRTLYFASEERDLPRLLKEYKTLEKYKLGAELWTRTEIEKYFPFSKPAGIVTNTDAEINPAKLNAGILQTIQLKGADLFENVQIQDYVESSTGVKIITSKGILHAGYVIFATGYAPPPLLSGIGVKLNRTFAIATKPIDNLSAWKDRMLIWETKRPYLYLRTTHDGRILAGGLDEKISHAPDEKYVRSRAEVLKSEVARLFPSIRISVDSSWGAIFAESADNLPYIGRHPEKNRFYYLLGYGGNGTVYSMLGSIILRDLIMGKPNKDADIVKLDR
jgi:glycine/D-amino acid oxidase-like deaminating enzyme